MVSSTLTGTAKFSRCCLQRPCYKFRVEALISQDSQFNWHRVTSEGLRPFFANHFAPFVYRLGHPPFTQVRAVRFCYGAPLKNSCRRYCVQTCTLDGLVGPSISPDIPKAMVKDLLAEDSKIRSARRVGTAIL